MNGKISMSKKIIDYAKDRNDFFCVHELGGFFNSYPFSKLCALVGHLKMDGILNMTDASESCKMQTKKHHFYIYNKKQNEEKPKIDEDGNDNFKPKISKNHRNMSVFQDIKNAVAKQKEEFCRHTIAKEIGKSPKEVASYLRILKNKRKLKYIGKKNCPDGQRAHKFYILVNKNLKNVKITIESRTAMAWKDKIPEIEKLISKGWTDREIAKRFGVIPRSIERMRHRYGLLKKRPLERIQKPQTESNLGVFIKCLNCGVDYLEEKENIMKNGQTECPRCKHKIQIGG